MLTLNRQAGNIEIDGDFTSATVPIQYMGEYITSFNVNSDFQIIGESYRYGGTGGIYEGYSVITSTEYDKSLYYNKNSFIEYDVPSTPSKGTRYALARSSKYAIRPPSESIDLIQIFPELANMQYSQYEQSRIIIFIDLVENIWFTVDVKTNADLTFKNVYLYEIGIFNTSRTTYTISSGHTLSMLAYSGYISKYPRTKTSFSGTKIIQIA